MTNNQYTNNNGYYGDNQDFGGAYVPEILYQPLQDLTIAFESALQDSEFMSELVFLQTNLTGRPSPLIFAKNLTQELGGAKIYFKNEGNNNLSGLADNYIFNIAKAIGDQDFKKFANGF